MTERGRAIPRGSLRRSLVGAVALTLAAVGTLTIPAAAAQTSPDIEVGTGGLTLISRSVQTTEAFELELQLPGVVEPDDVLVVAVHERVADRASFRDTLDGRRLGTVKIPRISAVAELNATTRGRVLVTIDRDTVANTLPDPGVYPVTIELRTASQQPLGRLITHLVRVVDEVAPPTRVALALIMDVAPQTSRPREMADTDTTAQWMDMIVSRPELPFTVQPTPWLFDQFRTDSRMRRFTTRLSTAEVIAAPYVPIDVRSLELAGLIDRADEVFSLGVETMTDVLGEEPITTRWLSRAEPNQEDTRLWYRRGVRDVVVSIDDENLAAPVEIATENGTLRALVSPSWFATANPTDPILGAHQLLAELAVIAMTGDGQTSSVLLFGTEAPFNEQFLNELLTGLTDSAVVDPVSLSEAVAIPQVVGRDGQPVGLITRETRDEELQGDVPLYLDALSTVAAYRSMINPDDTHRVFDEVNERLLLSLGKGITGLQRNREARAAIDKIRAEVDAVDPPPLGGVSLTSREATAPFSFRNTADYPLRVEVRFLADKARFVDFDDGETTTIVLEPGITTKEFRVQALSAGSFPLRIEMFSPDGALELGGVDLTMRSTVPSGVGVALTIGAIIVLVAWWGRDLLRSRRRVAA